MLERAVALSIFERRNQAKDEVRGSLMHVVHRTCLLWVLDHGSVEAAGGSVEESFGEALGAALFGRITGYLMTLSSSPLLVFSSTFVQASPCSISTPTSPSPTLPRTTPLELRPPGEKLH